VETRYQGWQGWRRHSTPSSGKDGGDQKFQGTLIAPEYPAAKHTATGAQIPTKIRSDGQGATSEGVSTVRLLLERSLTQTLDAPSWPSIRLVHLVSDSLSTST
jgi:hypothetical protein